MFLIHIGQNKRNSCFFFSPSSFGIVSLCAPIQMTIFVIRFLNEVKSHFVYKINFLSSKNNFFSQKPKWFYFMGEFCSQIERNILFYCKKRNFVNDGKFQFKAPFPVFSPKFCNECFFVCIKAALFPHFLRNPPDTKRNSAFFVKQQKNQKLHWEFLVASIDKTNVSK